MKTETKLKCSLQLFVFIVGYPSNLIWGTSEISSVVQCLGQLFANYDLKNHSSFIQFPFIWLSNLKFLEHKNEIVFI